MKLPQTSSTDLPSISVVTVNYNGSRHLSDCIRTLQAQSLAPIEIIVVDNGSTDNSEALVGHLGATWIYSGGNIGLGAAYNVGARAARARMVFLCNNDMAFDVNCLRELATALTRLGADGFSADPLQLSWDGTRVIHYQCVTVLTRTLRELISNPLSVLPPRKREYVESDVIADIPFSNGGSLLTWRDKFLELGGFDERFFMDWEDADLGWRANLRGWRNVFVPTAMLRHRWGGTSKDVIARYSRLAIRLGVSQQYNIMRFAAKNLSPLNAMAFVALRIFSFPVSLLRGRPHGALYGLLATLKLAIQLPDILAARRRIRRFALVSDAQLFERFDARGRTSQLEWPVPSVEDSCLKPP